MIAGARLPGVVALTTSIVLSAVAQLCMKVGMQKLRLATENQLLAPTWIFEPAALWTMLGIAAYTLSFVSWLFALIRYPLSYAYPFLGLSYVLVYIGATQWEELAEPLTPLRTAGTLFVIAGVALLSTTGPRGIGETRESI